MLGVEIEGLPSSLDLRPGMSLLPSFKCFAYSENVAGKFLSMFEEKVLEKSFTARGMPFSAEQTKRAPPAKHCFSIDSNIQTLEPIRSKVSPAGNPAGEGRST